MASTLLGKRASFLDDVMEHPFAWIPRWHPWVLKCSADNERSERARLPFLLELFLQFSSRSWKGQFLDREEFVGVLIQPEGIPRERQRFSESEVGKNDLSVIDIIEVSCLATTSNSSCLEKSMCPKIHVMLLSIDTRVDSVRWIL